MDKETRECILQMSSVEKNFDAMYRTLAISFGIPDCSMWILYYLMISEEDISQQELMKLMMFPKQTINSAVSSLVKKGYIELEMIPGTRNRKRILLTQAGKAFAERTVGKMIRAESAAIGDMGNRKMEQFMKLHKEFFGLLRDHFIQEGLLNDGRDKDR